MLRSLSNPSLLSITTVVILCHQHSYHLFCLWVIRAKCSEQRDQNHQLSHTSEQFTERSLVPLYSFGRNIQLWGCLRTCPGRSIHHSGVWHGRWMHKMCAVRTWMLAAGRLTPHRAGEAAPEDSSVSSRRTTTVVKFGLCNHTLNLHAKEFTSGDTLDYSNFED